MSIGRILTVVESAGSGALAGFLLGGPGLIIPGIVAGVGVGAGMVAAVAAPAITMNEITAKVIGLANVFFITVIIAKGVASLAGIAITFGSACALVGTTLGISLAIALIMFVGLVVIHKLKQQVPIAQWIFRDLTWGDFSW